MLPGYWRCCQELGFVFVPNSVFSRLHPLISNNLSYNNGFVIIIGTYTNIILLKLNINIDKDKPAWNNMTILFIRI